MSDIIPPHSFASIVDANGKMEQVFRVWTQDVSRLGIKIGTGTPETFVEGLQGQFYMDDAGTAGAILYIKRDADIGGDQTQGWILV